MPGLLKGDSTSLCQSIKSTRKSPVCNWNPHLPTLPLAYCARVWGQTGRNQRKFAHDHFLQASQCNFPTVGVTWVALQLWWWMEYIISESYKNPILLSSVNVREMSSYCREDFIGVKNSASEQQGLLHEWSNCFRWLLTAHLRAGAFVWHSLNFQGALLSHLF